MREFINSLSDDDLEFNFENLPKKERDEAHVLMEKIPRIRQCIGHPLTPEQLNDFRRGHIRQALRNSKTRVQRKPTALRFV